MIVEGEPWTGQVEKLETRSLGQGQHQRHNVGRPRSAGSSESVQVPSAPYSLAQAARVQTALQTLGHVQGPQLAVRLSVCKMSDQF